MEGKFQNKRSPLVGLQTRKLQKGPKLGGYDKGPGNSKHKCVFYEGTHKKWG